MTDIKDTDTEEMRQLKELLKASQESLRCEIRDNKAREADAACGRMVHEALTPFLRSVIVEEVNNLDWSFLRSLIVEEVDNFDLITEADAERIAEDYVTDSIDNLSIEVESVVHIRR